MFSANHKSSGDADDGAKKHQAITMETKVVGSFKTCSAVDIRVMNKMELHTVLI